MSKTLVIVESPTKARTLEKYLGSDYIVESSIGHIRDLPASAAEIPASHREHSWARLGVDIDNDFAPLYVVQSAKRERIAELKRALKDASELLLATDEDREGEAISWHLLQVLKPKIPVRRMVFHEITSSAIRESVQHTREIDIDLVEAQEARRIIDRLYGYLVSPILWKKITTGLSAGRVQSVAIRMLVERERARMRFVRALYWDLTAELTTGAGASFQAALVSLDGRKLAAGKDFSPDTGKVLDEALVVLDAEAAGDLAARLARGIFDVRAVEEKPFTRSPYPPFTTSTLQQEANRKLRFNARRTMRAAQRLYETGVITYMRTDSVTLSDEALTMTRRAVEDNYGREFLPDTPRQYRTKVRNAQEAHEAIRPAGSEITTVDQVRASLGEDEARLYELIWKRTMASQMKDAHGRRMTVSVRGVADGQEAGFQANGSVLDFAGFLRAYVEGREDPAAALADLDRLLPPVREGEALLATLRPERHETSPPQRLTEAGLVKALEESGIGRPSTYASIIDTIQRREYTFKKGNALVPTFTAFVVVRLMEDHLGSLIDTGFTARMEDRLDSISRGDDEPLPYLKEFYFGNGDPGLRQLVEEHAAEIDPRAICTIPVGIDGEGREIIVRVGRYGPFIQRGDVTANIPDQMCPDELDVAAATEVLAHAERGDEPIGHAPDSGAPVYVKVGRYGPYVQLGNADPEDKKSKPRMVSLLSGMSPAEVSLDLAMQLLELPRTVGQDADGVDVVVNNGRYGPYVKRGEDTRSLEPGDDLLALPLERALELLAQPRRGRGRGPTTLRTLAAAEHEQLGGKDLRILDGRYGPYVTDGETNASLPRGTDPATLDVAAAIELLGRRRETLAAGGGRRKKKLATRKSARGKATAKKKAPRKKAVSKKVPRKKAAGAEKP